ncbi:hypothetical protein SAMN05444390_10956 [Marinobacterium lutimaris]|uniref:Uncharacterized protein n=1 Tax=Marinobacterium lutimaris TaxID=568106 RepID=A0A1H6DTC6_9GAMM|nr:hypothetical protein SAMN05444390_10956 [Marinobacterium lutimaris]
MRIHSGLGDSFSVRNRIYVRVFTLSQLCIAKPEESIYIAAAVLRRTTFNCQSLFGEKYAGLQIEPEQ